MLQHLWQICTSEYELLEYIGTVQSDESWTIKETSDDVAMSSLSSSGTDSK